MLFIPSSRRPSSLELNHRFPLFALPTPSLLNKSGHPVKFWPEECMMFEFHQPSHSNSDFRILSFDIKRALQAVGVSELNKSEGWYRVQRCMKSELAMKSI